MDRKLALALTLAIIFIFGNTAQEAQAADPCNIKAEVKELQGLKKSSSTEDSSKELELRKKIISSSVDCIIKDSEEALDKVNDVPFNSNYEGLRNKVTEQIKGSIFFYNEKKEELKEVDIEKSKEMAKDLLEWKRKHDADLERATQFTIWAKNQPLLQSVEKRFGQITSLVRLNPGLSNMLDKAYLVVWNAKQTNQDAKEIIEKSDKPVEAWGKIKESLESMQQAYKEFIEINNKK